MSSERSEHARAREQSAPSHRSQPYGEEDERRHGGEEGREEDVRIEASLPRPKCLRNLLVLTNAAVWTAIILAFVWLFF